MQEAVHSVHKKTASPTTTRAGDAVRQSCAACILPSDGTVGKANAVFQPLSYISGTLSKKKRCCA